MKKKILALLLCAVLILSILPMAGAAADTYLDATGTAQPIPAGAVTITNQTAWGNSGATTWYVVDGTVSLGSVTVTGDVNLILADNCALTAVSNTDDVPGIRVEGTNSLTIYAQSNGGSMGKLTANGGYSAAGIGGGGHGAGGTITINGGSITANGGTFGAGIGGGDGGAGGTITINGGSVTAISEDFGAGIGGGGYGAGGTTTINGGTVNATGGYGAAGIGGGVYGDSGNITISGGSITATGQDGAASIGPGMDGSTGTITLNGTMYDENGKALTADDLKTATLSMTDVSPVTGPVVSVTTDVDVENNEVKYPGETFTVTVKATDAADYTGYVKLTYDKDKLELTGSTFATGANSNTNTAGEASVMLMVIPNAETTLATLTFTVKTLTADATTTIAVAEGLEGTQFTPGDAAMDSNAIAAELDPGSVTVSLCAGWPVVFEGSYNAETPISSLTVLPSVGSAAVPAKTSVTVPDGYVLSGWANVTDGDKDSVVLAADETTVAVTGPATYKAVYELDITVTQNIDYIGGYVRIVVTDNQDVFKNFSFTYGGETKTMFKLKDKTYAYMYAATKETVIKLDTASDIAAAKQLFTALNALAPTNDLSGRTGDALNDVNGSGKFDVADLRATYNCANASTMTGISFSGFVATCLRADLNGDGVVEATDVDSVIAAKMGTTTGGTAQVEG